MSVNGSAGSIKTPQFGTSGVVLNATPTVVSTFFQHVLTWPTRHKPKNAPSGSESPTSIGTLPANQLSYDQGLHVVKSFLNYASEHGVEELQGFSAQPVPIPHWLRREVVKVPQENIDKATVILTEQLAKYADGKGLELVGGKKWWQVRGRHLEGEWIEMSKHYQSRLEREAAEGTANTTPNGTTDRADKRKSWRQSTLGSLNLASRASKAVRDGSGAEVDTDRVILYIHGGAFFFSSLDLHRYQIERHARKAGARAFVPNYRLSPQYPFPCGLLDSLAAYLYLVDPPEGIKPIDPKNIILMGDSAGGGMCLSMLIVIREMGLPMPAAASLMSPWVDLTHSMPSISQWDGGDYIPNVGFHYRPSLVWPPLPVPENGIKVKLADGTEEEVDDQIQLYCPNNMLTHPLVSPINNGSLGGLCPLYITAGSAELLRDEVIYLAHKAADPQAYVPAPETLAEFPEQAAFVDKYPPTKVHLQVFEGACHVATTLAWTRSAKYIFRGTANFNIWAFKRAQRLGRRSTFGGDFANEPGAMSRTGSEGGSGATTPGKWTPQRGQSLGMSRRDSAGTTGTADTAELSDGTDSEAESPTSPSAGKRYFGRQKPLDHMQVRGVEPRSSAPIVAERVSIHGRITPMEPVGEVQALNPKLKTSVGRIRSDGPIGRWIEKRAAWDARWPDDLAKWRNVRAEDHALAEKQGFLTKTLQGEHPPPSALAGMADPELARKVGKSVDEPTTKTMVPVLLWSQLASKRDAEAAEDSDGEKKENPLKKIISGGSGKEKEGDGNVLQRIISGKPAREDGGPSPADSEAAQATGVAAEEAKMAVAGSGAQDRSSVVGVAALASAGVAAGITAAGLKEPGAGEPPHASAPVAEREDSLALSRMSSNASEYVLAQEVVDERPGADGVRQFFVTDTMTAAPESYDEPSPGVLAMDYARRPSGPSRYQTAQSENEAAFTPPGPAQPAQSTALQEKTNGQVVTPTAQQPAASPVVEGEGEPSVLSDTTAVASTLTEKPPAAPLANGAGKPPAAAVATEKNTNGAAQDAPALDEKAAYAQKGSKGVSDEYVDMRRKGFMARFCC